jgi:glutathione synthase
MSSRLLYPHSYPPVLSVEQQEFLVSTIKEWSIGHGVARLGNDPKEGLAGPLPVTLFPSLFPKDCFNEAIALQTSYNELYAAVASDETWLGSVVGE